AVDHEVRDARDAGRARQRREEARLPAGTRSSAARVRRTLRPRLVTSLRLSLRVRRGARGMPVRARMRLLVTAAAGRMLARRMLLPAATTRGRGRARRRRGLAGRAHRRRRLLARLAARVAD